MSPGTYGVHHPHGVGLILRGIQINFTRKYPGRNLFLRAEENQRGYSGTFTHASTNGKIYNWDFYFVDWMAFKSSFLGLSLVMRFWRLSWYGLGGYWQEGVAKESLIWLHQYYTAGARPPLSWVGHCTPALDFRRPLEIWIFSPYVKRAAVRRMVGKVCVLSPVAVPGSPWYNTWPSEEKNLFLRCIFYKKNWHECEGWERQRQSERQRHWQTGRQSRALKKGQIKSEGRKSMLCPIHWCNASFSWYTTGHNRNTS